MGRSRSWFAAVKSSPFRQTPCFDAETIEIVPYTLDGPTAFLEERKLLRAVPRRPWLIGEIEQVGSTGVACNVKPKPTIDIMASSGIARRSRGSTACGCEGGLCSLSPTSLSQMLWFCKPSPERRTHHLYLFPYKRLLWFGAIGLSETSCDKNKYFLLPTPT